jgi:glycosyltransferase involved in cell wall biosynthesis
MAGRLLFDISTCMRWFGPPVGIVRVERELAKWASQNDPNCRFVFFDPDLQMYREVRRNRLHDLLEGAATVDTTGMREASRSRRRRTDRVPRVLLAPFLWLTQFRRMALRTLGGFLLNSTSSRTRALIHLIQPVIAGKKYRDILIRPDGSQRALASVHVLAGAPLPFELGDRVLLAGANWAHTNVAVIGEQKKQLAIELISLCHDVIPLLFPAFFKPHDVAMLQRHFDQVFALASLNLVCSKVTGRDVQQYCTDHDIAVGSVRQVPLGFDLLAGGSDSASSAKSAVCSRYIMLVSTIEPRKGHRLAQAVWSKLLQEGIPQRLDVNLVLVGRPGWMVDDLMKTLRTSDRIVVMDNIDDRALAALYDQADFCIYPSEYEGYGLPVVEALARGKAVLASNVGVVPELQAGLLKQLPPHDEETWYAVIKEWLVSPEVRPTRDADGSTCFRHPSWAEAAAETFAAVYGGHRPRSVDQTSDNPRGR